MVQSVEKALRLLQELDTHGDWLGVRELARRVGLTAPTTHNLLKTLLAWSFVEFHPVTKQYRLGLAAIRLGEGADPLNSLRMFAHPYMEELARTFDETVAVLTWMDDQAMAVDWIQAEQPLAVTHNHGVVERPLLMASGRVLLAHVDRVTQLRHLEQENLETLGSRTPMTKDDVLKLLNKIAQDGYDILVNFANSGVAAVAAPVFDASGKIILAVGCSAPVSRSSEARLEQIKERLLAVTKEMTQKLRSRPQTTAASPAA